ncbi:MATE family efflux transporter [Candidatus Poribacteria bacterium]|nr:MAG: MATE family efflux transporter [Candidatus Poribacteria bacterium]
MSESHELNRQIFRLAIPNIISNFSVPLLGAVDTALMGRLETEHYLGAVGIGGAIFSFIYWGFGFLRMATTGMVAQSYGEEDHLECGFLLIRGLSLSFLIGLFLLCIQWLIIDISFYLMTTSAEVEQLGRVYFHIRIYAAPAVLCLHVFHGVFLGLQNAHYPMLLTITVNAINIILNILFVKVYGMKVEGVALATVIAQYIGLLFAIILFIGKYPDLLKTWEVKEIFAFPKLNRFLSISNDIFIRTLCLVFSNAYFTAKSAALSDTFLAINTILLQYINLMSYAIDGFAFAAESMIGKYKGAGDLRRIKDSIRHIFLFGFIFSGLFSLIFLLYDDKLLYLFTDKQELISQTKPYLIWIIIAPVINITAYIWDGIYLGATASKSLRNSMFVAMVLFLCSIYVLSPYGNHGLWAALTILLIVRGVILSVMAPKSIFK